MPKHYSRQERQNLLEQAAQQSVTLDGKLAVISGLESNFPVVRTLDRSASAEFSWSAVENILNGDGKFRT